MRSRYISPGYWHDPERTRASFLPAADDGSRTYLTGDLGMRLPDGTLVHSGRRDFQGKILKNPAHFEDLRRARRGALISPEEQAVLKPDADVSSHQRAHCDDRGLVASHPQHREFVFVASEQAVRSAAHEKEILRIDAEASHDAQRACNLGGARWYPT